MNTLLESDFLTNHLYLALQNDLVSLLEMLLEAVWYNLPLLILGHN
jgi:hypothetical protein